MRRLVGSCAAAFAIVAVLAPATQAARPLVNFWGNPSSASGEMGGEFFDNSGAGTGNRIAGVAVNDNSGDVYVADPGNNRVQQFTEAGAFVRAWGVDVSSANANEIQAVMVNATAGSFHLEFGAESTSDLPFDADPSEVRDALDSLVTIGGTGASVSVAGGPGDAGGTTPYLITFKGSLAGTDVATQLTGSSGVPPLSGGTGIGANTVTGSTFAQGGAVSSSFEVCEAASSCKKAAESTVGGGMKAPRGVAIAQDTGDVYVTDSLNLRVDEFDAEGNFIRAWGQNVVASGPHNAGTGFEVCGAADICQAGASAPADPGAFSGSGSGTGAFFGNPAVIPASAPSHGGDILVTDPQNARVQEFSSAGAFVRLFGGGVTYGGATGTGVLTSGSTTIASADTTTKSFRVGQAIEGTGIAPGTTVSSLTAGTIVLSQPATAAATGAPTALTSPAGTGNVDSNERQTLTVAATVNGGNFQLKFTAPNPQTGPTEATTSNIPFNATAAQVEAALTGLSNIGSGNVAVALVPDGNAGGGSVPGGPWTIEFLARYADTNVNQLSVASGAPNLTGGSATVATPVNGTQGFEVCSETQRCLPAISGSRPGQFEKTVARVTADSSGVIYTVELPTKNERVQKFTPQGSSPGLAASVFVKNILSGKDNDGNFTEDTNKTPRHDGPLGVAVDPESDHVFVAKEVRPPGLGISTESVVLELDGSGALLDTHMTGNGLLLASGSARFGDIAVQRSGSLYVTSTTTAPRVYAFGELPPPAATIAPVTVEGEAATLRGTVSPTATASGLVHAFYHFEYSKNGFEWTKAPAADVDLGDGSGPAESSSCSAASSAATCQVTQHVTGLDANQEYRVRLVASSGVGGSVTTVEAEPILTSTFPPVAVTGLALWSSPADTSPSLLFKGRVNPKHEQTGYSFAYVDESTYQADLATGDGFQHALSTPEAQAGHGIVAVEVARSAFGLDADKAYRYRLIASNPSGEGKGAVRVVSPPADGDRFYERVSVGDGTAGVDGTSSVRAISEDGNRASFFSQGLLADSPSLAQPLVQYMASRGPGGWVVRETGPEPAFFSGSELTLVSTAAISADLGTMLWPEATAGQRARGELRWRLRGFDGSVADAVAPLSPLAHQGVTKQYMEVGASGDLSTFVFVHGPPSGKVGVVRLLADEPLVSNQRSSLYGVFGAGGSDSKLDLVNRASDPSPGVPGAVIGGVCGAGLGGNAGYPDQIAVTNSSISRDGTTIYFSASSTAPSTGNCSGGADVRLYKRVNGEATVQVSASRCTPAPQCPGSPAGDDSFKGASEDGSVAFFTTLRRLTNSDQDSSADLYAYDESLSPGEKLVQVSAGETVGGHTSGSGAEVLGVLRSSADGSRVYFVAKGVLSGPNLSGASPMAGSPNLYVFQRDDDHPGGRVGFLGKLIAGNQNDEVQWSAGGVGQFAYALPAGGSGDGHYLLFRTVSRLVPEDTDNAEDIYRYDDDAGTAAEQLLCVSCAGNGGFGAKIQAWHNGNEPAAVEGRPASSDASRVVFTTGEQLAAGDQNSRQDVYLWTEGEGLGLITAGTEALGVYGREGEAQPENSINESGISPDGRDVFFVTKAALVESDRNQALDLYDARIGGGFPAAEATAACEGQGCQGPVEPAPEAMTPGSSTFVGAGNRPAGKKPCRKGSTRKRGKCVRKKGQKKRRHAGKHRRGASSGPGGGR